MIQLTPKAVFIVIRIVNCAATIASRYAVAVALPRIRAMAVTPTLFSCIIMPRRVQVVESGLISYAKKEMKAIAAPTAIADPIQFIVRGRGARGPPVRQAATRAPEPGRTQ